MSVLELDFDIPNDLWASENGGHGSRWVVTRKRRELRQLSRLKARELLADGHVQPFTGPVHVTAWIQYPTRGRADPANAMPTVKPLIDGLTQAGLWADDDSLHLIGPDMRREAEPTHERGLHRIRLVIEEEHTYA